MTARPIEDDALIEEIAGHIHTAIWSNEPLALPYANTSRQMQEYDRRIAAAALTAIERAGYRLVKDAGVRTYPTT